MCLFTLDRQDKLVSSLFRAYWLFRDEDGEAIAYGRFYHSKPGLHDILPVPIELEKKYDEYYKLTLDAVTDAEMNNIVGMELLPRIHLFYHDKSEDYSTLLTTYRFMT